MARKPNTDGESADEATPEPPKQATQRKPAKKATPKRSKKPAKPRSKKAREALARAETRRWWLASLALVLGTLAVRLVVLAAEAMPVHFDEAQYWAYGQELAWGYYSKPPGVGAVIALSTGLLGDTLFALRLPSPLAHAGIALLIHLSAARLFDARTGFWAAAGYTLAPGVTVSAMIVSTDPPMMLAWALALYALIRARASTGWLWWAVLGIAIGLGALAKYTMLAFAVGALGWGLFSAEGRTLRGAAIAAALAFATLAPNLLWNAANGFATLTHVAEDAAPEGTAWGNPATLAEFLGAQLGVIGPVFFLAILAQLWRRREMAREPNLALIGWLTFALLIPFVALSFASRAQPNWAAPAYICGSILAARWLLTRDWRRALIWGQAGFGVLAALSVYALAALYADQGERLPRLLDPFKKMRLSEPFCERALAAMDEEGAEVLLSDSRRRLSECMFLGGLGWDRIAVWNPDLTPANHHELVATLRPGDGRRMLLAVLGEGEDIAERFDEAILLEADTLTSHADRTTPYSLWVVQDFTDYGQRY
ncbi:MAG: glycosyltransferase family 39 protein [Pseudomonadota bacterium]